MRAPHIANAIESIYIQSLSYLLDNVSFLLNHHKYSLKCTYTFLA